MDVTLSELNDLGEVIKAKRDAIEVLKNELKSENEALELLENKFIQMMQDSGVDKYFIPEVGTAYVSTRFTYKVPKSPEDRSSFFEYLKQKGVYEDMITVHSQTLNSWAKAELDAAATTGTQDFQIPGLGDPSMYQTLTIRKA